MPPFDFAARSEWGEIAVRGLVSSEQESVQSCESNFNTPKYFPPFPPTHSIQTEDRSVPRHDAPTQYYAGRKIKARDDTPSDDLVGVACLFIAALSGHYKSPFVVN
ncbi:unnamed protein product, partial [Iphiclides podalirius]